MNNMHLTGRTALVTGSSRGIGMAIAAELAEQGARVIICGRNQAKLNAAQNKVAERGGSVSAIAVDGTKPNEVKKLFGRIKKIGQLDILVNNIGGVPTFGDFFSLTDKDWRDALELNLMSMVYFSREAIPLLKKSKHARIINIATVPARQPGQFNPHYSAAKAGMVNVSKHLANVLATEGILVNAVLPSTIAGENFKKRARDRAKRDRVPLAQAEQTLRAEDAAKVPLGVLGEADDVAGLVAFLASDAARYITGACISVDGGTTRAAF